MRPVALEVPCRKKTPFLVEYSPPACELNPESDMKHRVISCSATGLGPLTLVATHSFRPHPQQSLRTANRMKTITLLALQLAFLNGALLSAQAQGTAFTYQGRLNDNGSPAAGSYDLLLTIYDSASNPGTIIAGPVTNAATAVTGGLFTIALDFGASVFTGPPRWLEIGVRTNGGAAFTTLSPRQPLTAAPYAVLAGDVSATNIARRDTPNTAVTATGAPIITSGFVTGATVTSGGSGYTTAPAVTVNDATGSGAVITATVSNGAVASLLVQNAGHSYSPSATLTIGAPPSNAYQVLSGVNYFTGLNAFTSSNNTFAGSFSGAGTNLTGVNAATLGGLAAGQFWQLGGNAGTTPILNFLGTTDNQALQLRANGVRVLRLEPDPRGAFAGNLIGGFNNNAVQQPGSGGNVIGGGGFSGGPNVIRTNTSGAFIGAGSANQIGPNVNDAVIGGGNGNTIQSYDAVIGGGVQNTIRANSQNSVIGGGRQNVAAGEGATVAGGESSGSISNYATVGGGWFNVSSDIFATVGGGYQNTSGSYGATTGGGFQNTNNAQYATVGGGYQNTIQSGGNWSAICAGKNNTIELNADFDLIGGGFGNLIQNKARSSAIGGGFGNAIGTNTQGSVISGGEYNSIGNRTGDSTIGGGYSNVIQTNAFGSTIGGGYLNTIMTNADLSTIGGGQQNRIGTNANFATIGGGGNNQCTIGGATVGGGENNLSAGFLATVGGGYQNTASNFYATVAGGENNTVTADDAFIGGGFHNLGGGGFATVGGGANNNASGESAAIAGGENNTSSGDWSAVPGGNNNTAAGKYSFSAGRNARAPGDDSFVWNSYANPNYATGPDEFFVFAQNGFSVDYNTQRLDGGGSRWVYIGNGSAGSFPIAIPATIVAWNGAYLSDGGAWVNSSDRARKENFAPVDARSVLERVAALPIQTWNYTNEPPSVRHLGPMAQDFHAAFALNGDDDKHIADVDEGGVALAAIKALNQKVEEKEAAIQQLRQRLERLEERLNQKTAGER